MSGRSFPRSSRPFPSPASQLLHCIALISSNIITPPPVGIRAQTVHTHPVMLCSASSQLVLHLASIVSAASAHLMAYRQSIRPCTYIRIYTMLATTLHGHLYIYRGSKTGCWVLFAQWQFSDVEWALPSYVYS